MQTITAPDKMKNYGSKFLTIPNSKIVGLLIVISFLSLCGFQFPMSYYGRRFGDIVEFQLCWTKSRCIKILDEWGDNVKYAISQTWVDFGYLTSYTCFGIGFTLFSMRYVHEFQIKNNTDPTLQTISIKLFLITLIACILTGIFDCCENIVTLSILYDYKNGNINFTSATVFTQSMFAFFKWFIFGGTTLIVNLLIAPILAIVACIHKNGSQKVEQVSQYIS